MCLEFRVKNLFKSDNAKGSSGVHTWVWTYTWHRADCDPCTWTGGRPTKDNTEIFFQGKIWPSVTIRGSRPRRTDRL